VHTGQHYDERMSQTFVTELGMPEPDIFLGVGSGRHGEQTAKALAGVEEVLLEKRPDLLVVAGDVNSTLAAALAAVKLHVPVAHIESGLRSFDDTMPEEHNRRLTDQICHVLLTHSPEALPNLEREGVDPGRVHMVGNTMIDSLFRHRSAALAARPWEEYGLEDGGFALVTLHRPALVDDPELLGETVEALRLLSRSIPVLFPVHPRTRSHLEALGAASEDRDPSLLFVDPIGYLPFVGLQDRARFVLTDSGGVQEETSALGTRCFTLRDSTERPVTVAHGTNSILGARPEAIVELAADLPEPASEAPEIEGWDGNAGPRAADVILEFLDSRA
jgi:UDP-N-acetylglucosamine 2-epimerase (non-hydrolysing)